MRIAYFINHYPKVSHSFIRREILELEKQGVEVIRFSIRRNDEELVDQGDLIEAENTAYLVERGIFKILVDVSMCLTHAPTAFYHAILEAIKLGRQSRVGIIRHLFYLVEACVLNRSMKESVVSHVHAHFGTNSTAIVLLARFLGGVTYSFTAHGPTEFDMPLSLSLGEKIHHASFVVAISSYGRSQLYRWCEYSDWNKVQIIHCALGKVFLERDVIRVPDVPSVVCVGRLCEQKGQLLLIEAVHRLKEKGIPVELVLAGDGEMRDEIERLIGQYDLSSQVRITGWISSTQVLEEIVASRALVLPSFAEGLPVVLMEACALHRPSITTYIAGIPELIHHGENGWLIPAGSVEHLCDALIELLNSTTETLDQMGENAYKQVCINHTIHSECSKLKALFYDVVTNK